VFHFQEFLFAVGEKWRLESLTIGPLTRKTDYNFWHKAFHDFPAGPRLNRLNDLTIIYRYPNGSAFVMRSWDYFDALLSRTDIFPQSMRVDIKIMDAISTRTLVNALGRRLRLLRQCRAVTFDGKRECGSFWTASLYSPNYNSTSGFYY
jgi:hypothetical protein